MLEEHLALSDDVELDVELIASLDRLQAADRDATWLAELDRHAEAAFRAAAKAGRPCATRSFRRSLIDEVTRTQSCVPRRGGTVEKRRGLWEDLMAVVDEALARVGARSIPRPTNETLVSPPPSSARA